MMDTLHMMMCTTKKGTGDTSSVSTTTNDKSSVSWINLVSRDADKTEHCEQQ